MRKVSFLIFSLFLVNSVFGQESYKDMINDNSINFYDVCKAAETHFSSIDKDVKGSGYKGYMRWKIANEYKYYPSGDRSNIDPYFAENAFTSFLENGGAESISFTNGWNDLGPLFVDSISGHYSAGLGRVEDHYVDPSDTNTMYVGSRSGGFWKTNDGGQTWQGSMTDTLVATGVNAIAVSPTNHDSILINTRNSRNAYSHGIYRSVDGGNSWTVTNFNPITLGFGGLGSNFQIYTIEYHPTIPNLIFVGTSKGIFRSADNLQTWTQLYSTSPITDIKFHPTNSSIIYILNVNYYGSVRNHVLRSIDGGLSYVQSQVITGNNNYSGKLSVSNGCSDCVYFASSNGVWKSLDSAQTFTFISNPNSSCGDFAVNDVDTLNMIYGYLDLYRTTSGGNSFSQVSWWSLGSSQHGTGNFQTRYANSTAYVHADLRNAKCINGVFYVGTDGTFSKSTDNGLSWQVLSEGIGIRENYKLGVSQSNHYRSVSGSQDNGTSIKLKESWLEFYGADGMEGIIHPLNDDWIIGSVQFGTRRRTLDGGQTQSNVTPPGGGAYWEAPITYSPLNPMKIYDFRDSVYVSNQFGDSWTIVGGPSSFTGDIYQSAIAENDSNIIVISRGSAIDKSTNGGTTFSSIKSNLPSGTIQDIAFDPKNDNVIIVVYGSYYNNNQKVYITSNGGTSWVNITGNLGNMPLRSVVIDHSDSSYIYLGAEIGVYVKSMAATNWTLYNPNLPNTTIEELEIVYGSNTIKAATWGRGLWEYNLVGRASFPSIVTTKITDTPTLAFPKEGMDQFVTSVISYDNSLDSVFVRWSVNSITLDSIIPMINTVDSTWITQTALPNYPAGTNMYFKVFSVGNSNDTTETYRFMYKVRPFQYCDGIGTNSGGNLYINNFQTANVTQISGNTGYIFYANKPVYLFVDSTYSISLTANTSWSSNDCQAWIDFNGDASFDPSESLGLPPFTGYTSNTSFTVPSNANITDTLRLRARLSYWSSVASPCGTTLGEVEDYPVLIRQVPNLSFSISSTNICQGSDVIVEYTGGVVDSVVWTFDNGTQTFTGTGMADTLTISADGIYDLNLTGYIFGIPFSLDSNAILTVLNTDETFLNLSSCNPQDTGVFIQYLTNTNGCDSVITTVTSLLQSDSLVIDTGSCNSSDVGTVIQTLTNANGCDSVVVTNTSLLPTDSILVNLTSCITSDIGTVIQTFSNSYGCDSVVTTATVPGQISASVVQANEVLTAQPSGAEYQWLDCEGFVVLTDDTNQVFTANINGYYAVLVTDGACADTSECVLVTGLSVGEERNKPELLIYPNPTDASITIELSNKIKLSEFRIFTIIGKDVTNQIKMNEVGNDKITMDFSKVASGVYVIRTHSTTNKITKN